MPHQSLTSSTQQTESPSVGAGSPADARGRLGVDGRTLRAERQRQARRAQVLEVARRVFGEKGYHSASVSDIIKRAGIARGTFYLYFDSKRAIFEELLDGYLERIWGVVRRVVTGGDAPSAEEQVKGNIVRVLDVLDEHRSLNHILLWHAVGLDQESDQRLSTFYERLLSLIEGALLLGQEMGVVRDGDARMLAVCVLGSIKEVTAQYLVISAPREFDRDAAAEEILGYVLRGLQGARPGAGGRSQPDHTER